MSAFTFAVAVLGTNGIAQIYKNVQTKYGTTKMHAALAIIALAVSIVITFFSDTQTFRVIVEYAGAIFTTAIATYEVIFKKIGSVTTPTTDSTLQ